MVDKIEKKEEQKMIINHNDKEIEFVMSDLSNEGQMSFVRANQLGQEIQNLEQQINERRFLASNYVNSVINELNKDDVRAWTKDLIINKTHSGLQIQLEVLKLSADDQSYRLANVEEEAKGIDGFIGDKPVSIKPNTYKKTINAGKETIPYHIIYYTNGSKGVKIV